MPWWLKLAAKLVIARLPVPYGFWRRVGLLTHGDMAQPAYAVSAFRRHRAALAAQEARSWTGLEVGPGNSVASALVAAASGASRYYLIDRARYATPDLAPYRTLAAHLASLGMTPPDLRGIDTLDGLLAACNAAYLTEGVSSFRAVPDGSIDLSWSQAVVEHVRAGELAGLAKALFRAARPGGASSHRIDLQDHLACSINNLRFPAWFWESALVVGNPVYTNRLRPAQLTQAFAQAGWQVSRAAVDRWTALPVAREKLDRAFRALPESDLLAHGMDLVLQRAPLPETGH